MVIRTVARLLPSAIAGIVMLATGPSAMATTGAPATGDGLTACERSVSRIGAQMGHTLQKGADGGVVYVFVVRSDGGNYAVRCEGGTGTLGAIDRLTHSAEVAATVN